MVRVSGRAEVSRRPESRRAGASARCNAPRQGRTRHVRAHQRRHAKTSLRGVEFNVLATVNGATAPHGDEIYRFLTDSGAAYLQFIPVLERAADGSPAAFSCGGEALGRFLLDVFEQWLSRDVGRVSERFFDHILNVLVLGRATTCCHAPRCANAMVLEPSGDVYACDHFVRHQWRLGNLLREPLEQLAACDLLDEFAADEAPPARRLPRVQIPRVLQRRLPQAPHSTGDLAPGTNHFCEGYKLFFARRCRNCARSRGRSPPSRPPRCAAVRQAARKREIL